MILWAMIALLTRRLAQQTDYRTLTWRAIPGRQPRSGSVPSGPYRLTRAAYRWKNSACAQPWS